MESIGSANNRRQRTAAPPLLRKVGQEMMMKQIDLHNIPIIGLGLLSGITLPGAIGLLAGIGLIALATQGRIVCHAIDIRQDPKRRRTYVWQNEILVLFCLIVFGLARFAKSA